MDRKQLRKELTVALLTGSGRLLRDNRARMQAEQTILHFERFVLDSEEKVDAPKKGRPRKNAPKPGAKAAQDSPEPEQTPSGDEDKNEPSPLE